MDPHERRMLERALRLAEENNELLHKLHRAELFRRWVRIAYWAIILIISLGTYYFIQPYIEQAGVFSQSVLDGVEHAKEVGGTISNLGGLLERE